jgi:hypothetical protein
LASRRGVGLAVAAAGEPEPVGLSRRGGDRRGAGQPRERALGSEPFGVVAGGDQQGGGGVDPDPATFHELGCGGRDEPGELPVEVLDLGVDTSVRALA